MLLFDSLQFPPQAGSLPCMRIDAAPCNSALVSHCVNSLIGRSRAHAAPPRPLRLPLRNTQTWQPNCRLDMATRCSRNQHHYCHSLTKGMRALRHQQHARRSCGYFCLGQLHTRRHMPALILRAQPPHFPRRRYRRTLQPNRDGRGNTVQTIWRGCRTKASAQKSKYSALCANIGCKCVPAVIERFGTCSDSFVGYIRVLGGAGERNPFTDVDYSFSATSRVTYVAQRIVFATVIVDADMVQCLCVADINQDPPQTSSPTTSELRTVRRRRSSPPSPNRHHRTSRQRCCNLATTTPGPTTPSIMHPHCRPTPDTSRPLGASSPRNIPTDPRGLLS